MKRIIIKLGTGILSQGEGKIRTDRMDNLANDIAKLSQNGIKFVIVSSGAVGLGMGKLGLSERPKDLSLLRACASIGQCQLMNAWNQAFEKSGLLASQVLLTREDFENKKRSQKVQETLESLLKNNVIPIVNENDSVCDEEIKLGDNDVLSALLSSVGNADFLLILSTVKGLMTHPNAGLLIPFVAEITPSIEIMAKGTQSATSVGGMTTKIEAAKIATKSGCAVFIASGEEKSEIAPIINGEDLQGTFFAPMGLSLSNRRKWLPFYPSSKGMITLSKEACKKIMKKNSSLFANGIITANGPFEKADVVEIKDPEGKALAIGITRFSLFELQGIVGMDNNAILNLFPGRNRPEVIHNDHIILLND